MIYSPYRDRNSGGTRTNVDTEVHDDRDQEHRADGIGPHANGRDANDRDGTAMPVQRRSPDDESVGGDVVDRRDDVVGATDGDPDGGARPEAVNAEAAESIESAEAPDAVRAEQADTPDAEANADGVSAAETEPGTDEDPGGVQTHEATATDVDARERAEGTAERDSAAEQAMAGDDGPTGISAGVVVEHHHAERAEADRNDADAVDEAESEPVRTAYAEFDAGTMGAPTMVPAIDAGSALAGSALAGANVYGDDAEVDRTASEGAVGSDGPTDIPHGEAPVNAADADYVAVGVAEPMTQSEVADLANADAGGSDTAQDPGGDVALIDVAPMGGDVAQVNVPPAGGDVGSVDPVLVGGVPVGGDVASVDAGPVGISRADAVPAGDGVARVGGVPVDGDIALVDAASVVDAAPVSVARVDDVPMADETVLDSAVRDRTPVGDAPVPDAPALVPSADAIHDRWQQIQLGFIDDPRGSVESARSLVVEAVEVRIAALRDRQAALDGWQREAAPDTEMLRAAIQGYRDLLNSLTTTP